MFTLPGFDFLDLVLNHCSVAFTATVWVVEISARDLMINEVLLRKNVYF